MILVHSSGGNNGMNVHSFDGVSHATIMIDATGAYNKHFQRPDMDRG